MHAPSKLIQCQRFKIPPKKLIQAVHLKQSHNLTPKKTQNTQNQVKNPTLYKQVSQLSNKFHRNNELKPEHLKS